MLRHVLIALIAVLGAACVQTSRVSDTLDASSLARSQKAVALIKVGAADPACQFVHVVLARKDGESYRVVQTMRVALRPDTEPAVAEAELDPGEYHVVNYACFAARGQIMLGSQNGPGQHSQSLASFTLASGEVVNLGYLRLAPLAVTRQVFSRTRHWVVAVTDWPLPEIDRFKKSRPKLYAAMHTRLMTVHKREPITAEQRGVICERAKQLKDEGKVQNMPVDCTPAGKAIPVVPAKSDKAKSKIDA